MLKVYGAYIHIFLMFLSNSVPYLVIEFVTLSHFHPSLVFYGKAKSLTLILYVRYMLGILFKSLVDIINYVP